MYPSHSKTAFTRRGFLQAGSALSGSSLAGIASAAQCFDDRTALVPRLSRVRHCITLLLVGSPGHLDTWDMKPDAPSEIRGPFRPIATNVPGIKISEHFPRLAMLADRLNFVRGMHHEGAPLHETGQRYAMTGADFGIEQIRPHHDAVVARLFGQRAHLPANVILPPLRDTGAGNLHGQTAGWLGAEFDPATLSTDDLAADDRGVMKHAALNIEAEPLGIRELYGDHPFGRHCLLARRLIERGVRSVTVNQFSSLFRTISWDMHAAGPHLPTKFVDYEHTVCPQFDQACSALLVDLESRGLLAETVVAVVAEMGRTPRINPRGGRDHFTPAWTNLLAGGTLPGGRVLGATSRDGSEVVDRPVSPAEFLATVYRARGINLAKARMPGADGLPIPLVGAEPLEEIF